MLQVPNSVWAADLYLVASIVLWIEKILLAPYKGCAERAVSPALPMSSLPLPRFALLLAGGAPAWDNFVWSRKLPA